MQAQVLKQDVLTSPFWQFDRKLGHYRDKSTGRFLSQANLDKLQKRHIALVKRDINQVGQLLLRGQISLKTWQEATAQSIKTLHLHQSALGKGGIKQMSTNDWLAAGREIRTQYSYLRGFAIDVQRGYSINSKGEQVPMTEARFMARLGLYSDASRVSYDTAQKQSHVERGYQYGRRFLGAAHHCPECPRIASRGVVPISQVILPTQQCSCRARCKCRIKWYRTLEEAGVKVS